MCGRYTLYDFQELYDEYSVPDTFELSPNYNVAPTQTMPIVTNDGLQMMRWGYIPVWAKDEKIGYKLINTRSETVFKKPMWRGVVMKHRCLVPANGFYEWQKQPHGKQPFYIHPKDRNLFMFAGIWGTWRHEGEEWHTYSIMTTSPSEDMKPIHDRMPVILHEESYMQWLQADRKEDIEPLLLPYEDNGLEMFEVGKDVNVTSVNNSHLVTPVRSS